MAHDEFRREGLGKLSKRMRKKTGGIGGEYVNQPDNEFMHGFWSDSGVRYKDRDEWQTITESNQNANLNLDKLSPGLDTFEFKDRLHTKVKRCSICQRPSYRGLEREEKLEFTQNVCNPCERAKILRRDKRYGEYAWNNESLGSMIGGNADDGKDYLKALFDSNWMKE